MQSQNVDKVVVYAFYPSTQPSQPDLGFGMHRVQLWAPPLMLAASLIAIGVIPILSISGIARSAYGELLRYTRHPETLSRVLWLVRN